MINSLMHFCYNEYHMFCHAQVLLRSVVIRNITAQY
jgi:hypothetical protein